MGAIKISGETADSWGMSPRRKKQDDEYTHGIVPSEYEPEFREALVVFLDDERVKGNLK